MRIDPAVGRKRPANSFNNVDFPHPERPATQTKLPGAMASEMPDRTGVEPRCDWYD